MLIVVIATRLSSVSAEDVVDIVPAFVETVAILVIYTTTTICQKDVLGTKK